MIILLERHFTEVGAHPSVGQIPSRGIADSKDICAGTLF